MTAEAMIELDSATEGMVLSRHLLDAGGSMLLPEGSTLTAASLASLRRRGIDQLQVVVAADPAASAAAAAALQEQRAHQCRRLEHLFRASAGLGATARLLERLRAYRKGE